MSNKYKGVCRTESSAERTLNIGHGSYVVASRILAIIETGSLPVKRLREKALEQNLLVDATAGRKMRSMIVLDSQHIVVSALAPQTLHDRLNGLKQELPLDLGQVEVEQGLLVS